jgi:hypothetical protein
MKHEGHKQHRCSLKHAQQSTKTLHAETGKRCFIILTQKAGAITAAKLVPDQKDTGPFSLVPLECLEIKSWLYIFA